MQSLSKSRLTLSCNVQILYYDDSEGMALTAKASNQGKPEHKSLSNRITAQDTVLGNNHDISASCAQLKHATGVDKISSVAVASHLTFFIKTN